MMESMISSPVPTRAEVSDVAQRRAGRDAKAVMLSAETASGKYAGRDRHLDEPHLRGRGDSAQVTARRDFLDRVFTRVDQSIAMAALFTRLITSR